MVRSDKFCSQRCSNQWSEKNSSPETPGKTGAESEPMEVDKIPVQQKKVARALKNLQIDMACECVSVCVSYVHRGSKHQTQ